MKQFTTYANKLVTVLVTAVLCVVPFHAFLTVWASSIVGHYTALRLWDDVLLLVVFLVACGWLARDRELLRWFTRSLLVRLILAYTVLTILLGCVALAKGEVTGKALAYGLLVNLRYLAWFLAVLLTAQRSVFLKKSWKNLLLYPAALVVVFAVLQFTVLPHDYLGHFGYNANTTIAPIETINHDTNYIRVQSFLRGANPLGAYLMVVLAGVLAFYARGRRRIEGVAYGALVLTLVALYASGSRSAWIGGVLVVGVFAWLRLKSRRSQLVFGGAALAVTIVAALGYLLLKNNVNVQNELLHTQTNSAVKVTSNGAHASALREGVHDVLHQPLGDGPGTAGPSSVYNGSHSARIAEDYYIQIAQEVGWVGIALLLAIFTLVAMELYEQAGASPLALVMFTSFIGLGFVNLLSHAWTDDTLAYVWWGFAGIALARPQKTAKKHG